MYKVGVFSLESNLKYSVVVQTQQEKTSEDTRNSMIGLQHSFCLQLTPHNEYLAPAGVYCLLFKSSFYEKLTKIYIKIIYI